MSRSEAPEAEFYADLTLRIGPGRDEARRWRARLASLAALVFGAHIAGLVALDLFDRQRPSEAAGATEEIPVEIVAEGEREPTPPDTLRQPPPTPAAPQGAPPAPGQAVRPPPQTQPTPPAPAPQPGRIVERPRETGLTQKPGARGDDSNDRIKPEPEENPFGGLAPLAEAKTEHTPVFLSPETYSGARRAAAPNPANDNYRAKVLGMVAAAVVDPDRPRPKALAVVAFSIDDTGALASISLARQSGYADLDAEALDYVRRAAPFPAPPANADRNFAAAIPFGGD